MGLSLLSWFLSMENAFGAAIFLSAILAYRTFSPSSNNLPPGPKPLPIIGNALQMPTDQMEEVFTEWGAQYVQKPGTETILGDVVYARVFAQPMLVLNSLQAARDLLDRRSAIYSDRPRFVLLSELFVIYLFLVPRLPYLSLKYDNFRMGWSSASTHYVCLLLVPLYAHLSLRPSGPRFRKHRRFINQVFNHRAVAAFRPLQKKETIILLEAMSQTPDSFVDHFRRYAAGTILKITYGYDVVSVDDLFVQLAERAGTLTVEAGSAAANMVDFFPLMRQASCICLKYRTTNIRGNIRHIPTWAPFSTFKIKALECRKAVEAMMDIPFEQVKTDMRSGTAVPSYTSTLLDDHRDSDGSIAPEDEEDIKGSAGTLLAAAEDTTIASMHTFVLAMVLNPHEFKKAQEEIDMVVGQHRLPNLDDRPSLPYFDCVLKEVLRWSPMVPLGMPHRLMEDDFYRNFYIPKGTIVMANIYAILRDCNEPDVFRPQRYLDDETLPDPLGVIFGFGRRICPGRHLAEASYWTMAAAIVSAFDISKVLDEHGNEVGNPKYEFTHGFVRPPDACPYLFLFFYYFIHHSRSHPKPFKCSIKPRSSNFSNIINQARLELDS
ncbi:LOW QUALITY PROTEIN: hypothetical protein CVT25_001373 [Psilocybe cyanescens]|uniref:Cytochrome P450 n=1 Tax=Psilocybe cyanescens TaxID=93625 RepID=A0A409XHG4_PSICY|nr:LOW QUALITY PROTEIN: hypothetical protein CVT25_001373 [Psilocybe cyanescens]